MEWKIIHIDETDSTNRWLKEDLAADLHDCIATPHSQRENATLSKRELTQTVVDVGVRNSPLSSAAINDVHKKNRSSTKDRSVALQSFCVVADYQTAGRGCGTNRWESERGKNLLFSLLIHPEDLPANKQFQISMAISLAIVDALGQLVGDLSIKWPNDIYWRNGKLAGILIENTLKGNLIKESIIGVGLNVNQREFHSDAPNPVSLWQITGRETSREQLLKDILQAFDNQKDTKGADPLAPRYMQMLYRRKGFHPYTDKNGVFMAQMIGVEDDGHLHLLDDNGKQRRYAFKEVVFI